MCRAKKNKKKKSVIKYIRGVNFVVPIYLNNDKVDMTLALLSFCSVFNSRISGTQFGRGLPRSAHAHAQSDSAVGHQTAHAQNEGGLCQTESQNSAIENPTKGQQC